MYQKLLDVREYTVIQKYFAKYHYHILKMLMKYCDQNIYVVNHIMSYLHFPQFNYQQYHEVHKKY